MSGFLTALNAIAGGAQGGFNVLQMQQQQKQKDDALAQAKADRQRQLDEMLATRKALFNAQNPSAGLPAPDTMQGDSLQSDSGPNIPTIQPGQLPFGQQSNQSATPVLSSPANTFDPNVDYSVIQAYRDKQRQLGDTEENTKANRELVKSNSDFQHTLGTAQLAETQRQHDAGVANAADITAHAPAARAWLRAHGADESGMTDQDAVTQAQSLQHDLIVQRNKPETTPGSLQMFTGTDGQPHTFNNKTGEIGDAAVGKAAGGGIGAAGLKQSHAILNGALQTIDEVIGQPGADGTTTGGELAKQPIHAGLRMIPLVGSEIANAVSPTSAGLRAKIGIIAGAVPQLEARGRVNAKLLEMMKDAIPDPRQPVTAATRGQLEVLRTRFKAMLDDLASQSPDGGAAATAPRPKAAADWLAANGGDE